MHMTKLAGITAIRYSQLRQKPVSDRVECPPKIGRWATVLLAYCATFSAIPGHAAKADAVAANAPSPFTYADVADIAGHAPTILVGTIRSLIKIRTAQDSTLPVGQIRYFVTADVSTLIRGDNGIAQRIEFVIDLSSDRNTPRALKGQTVILFGRSAGGGQALQLLSSRALLPWNMATEQKVRSIVQDLVQPDAPPVVTGISGAFHTAGTVAGEGETQIFLNTSNNRPISLSAVRRPNAQPELGASIGEVVGENAHLPAHDTLLWYRLACGLPDHLPPSVTSSLSPADAEAADTDYQAIRSELGPCARTRPPLELPQLGKAAPAG